MIDPGELNDFGGRLGEDRPRVLKEVREDGIAGLVGGGRGAGAEGDKVAPVEADGEFFGDFAHGGIGRLFVAFGLAAGELEGGGAALADLKDAAAGVAEDDGADLDDGHGG